jgi:hypothetical protein
MSDYKYEMQRIAEEAAERDGHDFYALPLDQQIWYFGCASTEWAERRMQAADLARDREREG